LNNESAAMAINCIARLQIIYGNNSDGRQLACFALNTAETLLAPEHPGIAAINQTLTLTGSTETIQKIALADSHHRSIKVTFTRPLPALVSSVALSGMP
jgi:hypothetical protein